MECGGVIHTLCTLAERQAGDKGQLVERIAHDDIVVEGMRLRRAVSAMHARARTDGWMDTTHLEILEQHERVLDGGSAQGLCGAKELVSGAMR